MPQIKSLRFINTPDEGIAKSRRSTGEVVVNKHYWKLLPDEHKLFVLLHECGHIEYNTVDEFKADSFASDKYLEAGFPISESVKALAEHLDRNNPVHIGRAWVQYQRALQFDFRQNNNIKAFRNRYDTATDVKKNIKVMNNYEPEYTNFLGIAIGKKAKARKAEKIEIKNERKRANIELKNSKAYSRRTLADQGIVQPSGAAGIGAALGSVASLAGNLTGMSQAGSVLSAVTGGAPSVADQVSEMPPAVYNTNPSRSMGSMANDQYYAPNVVDTSMPLPTGSDTPKKDDTKKDKNMPFIIGGIAVAVLVVVMVMLKK